MKRILFILITLPVIGFSQEPAEGVFPLKDNAIYYEKVIQLDSLNRESIYRGVKSWAISAFKSQKDVLQADDKEVGLLAYKYWFPVLYVIPKELGVTGSDNWRYDATMKIFIKDYKVKIIIQDLTLKPVGDLPSSILTIRGDADSIYKDYQLNNKKYAKILEKFNTEEFKKAQYGEVKRNFQKANDYILALLANLETYLTSNKSEFDF